MGTATVGPVSGTRPAGGWSGVWFVAGFLAVALSVRSTLVPSASHTWFNLAMLVGVALLAVALGMDRRDLGILRRDVASGVRWGGVTAGVVVAAVVVAASIPALAGAFDDARVHIELPALLIRVLVIIPIATVALEELAFRGLLLASLARVVSTTRAIVLSAVAFGLWHAPGAWRSADANAVLDEAATSTAGRLGIVVATVAATTVAGLVFAWLRVRSQSLVAPIMVHVATNVTPFVAAWVLAR